MEFSTERSLGYLAGNRHKFYAMAHHKVEVEGWRCCCFMEWRGVKGVQSVNGWGTWGITLYDILSILT